MSTLLSFLFPSLAPNQTPHKSSLQSLVCSITATTYQRIHRAQLKTAREQKIETGRVAAIDSTVTATNIKAPYDSDLLGTAVKEMCRLLDQGLSFTPEPLYQFTHHNRVVKKTTKSRATSITRNYYTDPQNSKNPAQARFAGKGRETVSTLPLNGCPWIVCYRRLNQTERRVFKGEKVPAQEKIVSLYEPHTDIIVKDRRDVPAISST